MCRCQKKTAPPHPRQRIQRASLQQAGLSGAAQDLCPEEWTKDIDEDSLVRVEKSYVLQDF
ncbi:hypothetical protein, partial [Desulforamulus profundi]|uniref:hypothetical protein n=1 Tax=Desulforamulus profundi TaxID=1383067 RepID=UPI001EE51C80